MPCTVPIHNLNLGRYSTEAIVVCYALWCQIVYYVCLYLLSENLFGKRWPDHNWSRLLGICVATSFCKCINNAFTRMCHSSWCYIYPIYTHNFQINYCLTHGYWLASDTLSTKIILYSPPKLQQSNRSRLQIWSPSHVSAKRYTFIAMVNMTSIRT